MNFELLIMSIINYIIILNLQLNNKPIGLIPYMMDYPNYYKKCAIVPNECIDYTITKYRPEIARVKSVNKGNYYKTGQNEGLTLNCTFGNYCVCIGICDRHHNSHDIDNKYNFLRKKIEDSLKNYSDVVRYLFKYVLIIENDQQNIDEEKKNIILICDLFLYVTRNRNENQYSTYNGHHTDIEILNCNCNHDSEELYKVIDKIIWCSFQDNTFNFLIWLQQFKERLEISELKIFSKILYYIIKFNNDLTFRRNFLKNQANFKKLRQESNCNVKMNGIDQNASSVQCQKKELEDLSKQKNKDKKSEPLLPTPLLLSSSHELKKRTGTFPKCSTKKKIKIMNEKLSDKEYKIEHRKNYTGSISDNNDSESESITSNSSTFTLALLEENIRQMIDNYQSKIDKLLKLEEKIKKRKKRAISISSNSSSSTITSTSTPSVSSCSLSASYILSHSGR